MANATTLRIVLGDYPHTLPLKRGEITSPWLKLEFIEVKPLFRRYRCVCPIQSAGCRRTLPPARRGTKSGATGGRDRQRSIRQRE